MKKLFILGLMISLLAFGASKSENKAAKAVNTYHDSYGDESSFTLFAGAENGMEAEEARYLSFEIEPYLMSCGVDGYSIKTLKLTNDPNELPDDSLGDIPYEIRGCTFDDGYGTIDEDAALYVYLVDQGGTASDGSPNYECILYAGAATIYAHQYSFAYFADFYNVVEMDLHLLNTSRVEDMSYMFSGCWSLQTLNISGWDTSNVKNMNGMFAGAYSNSTALDNEYLTSLDISHFDTSNVTTMEYMFNGCGRLENINLGAGFNTSKVTTMQDMFSGCDALKSINVSNFNTSNVTNMNSMFSGCYALEKIEGLQKFNTSKVTEIDSMFSGCNLLKNLDLSSFDLDQVTSELRYFFAACTGLEYIKSPKSLPAASTTDANKALSLPEQFVKVYNINALTAANLADYPILTLISETAQKFINDWRALRARGGAKGICAALVEGSEENTILIQLLTQYDGFDSATQSSINAAEDTTGVTIGETIIYVKTYMAKNQTADKAALGSFMAMDVKDNSAYLIMVVALTGMLSIAGYYFYNKKKHAM